MTLPKARTERLTVRELADETLVYDHDRQRAHCLNATAALVWRHCNGRTSIAELAALLPQARGAEAVVRLALDQLSRRGLLTEPVAPLPAEARLTRRDTLKKLVVAAVALPAVMSILAPKAWAGFSSGADKCQKEKAGTPCNPSPGVVGTCCGGNCVTSDSFLFDSNNCGTCGNKCSADKRCNNGNCIAAEFKPITNCAGVANGTSCSGGTCCNGHCVSPSTFQSDNNNCGRCGHQCTGGQICQNGSCVCPSGMCVAGSPCPFGFTCTAPAGQLCGTCPI